MSSSSSLTDYRSALTAPGAGLPALASAVARLPMAMIGLATLLYVQRTTGSFAMAGLVSAGMLIGVSLGSVAQGRLIDRIGPTRPLLIAAAAQAAAGITLIVAIESRANLITQVACAAAVGLTQPAMPGSSRALWTRLVAAGRLRDAAFSYEVISLEVFFILGPSLAALLITTPWPGTGTAVALTCMVVGSAGFALTRAVRTHRPAPSRKTGGAFGALASPGLRTVVLASLGFGLVIGTVEVGVPAVTAAAGSAALGGVLLSAWSVASVLAGIAYSMHPWPRQLRLRLPVLLLAFAVCVAGMAATGPLPALVVVMVLAGSTITPQVTTHSLGVEATAPAGTATEAFGWVVTAATLGLSAGQSGAGLAVQAAGPHAAFLVGGAAGLVVAGLLWLRRTSLVQAQLPAQVVQLSAHR
jgi:Major Facilitator Superfamily